MESERIRRCSRKRRKEGIRERVNEDEIRKSRRKRRRRQMTRRWRVRSTLKKQEEKKREIMRKTRGLHSDSLALRELMCNALVSYCCQQLNAF
jgi:Flp pilus assembly protein TadB